MYILVIIFALNLNYEHFFHSRVVRDLNKFKRNSDVVIANRKTKDLNDVPIELFTRDLLGSDS
jgi:UDPglucose 6-dehydrogenase